MEFGILGPLIVARAGVPISLGTPKARHLLACLIIHANQVVSIDRLAEALWGESPPATAFHAVQNHISDLRRALKPEGDSSIVTRPPGYLLEVPLEDIDARRFERLLEEARSSLRAGAPDRAAVQVREALALWRGEPLAEFTYEEFAQSEIRRLEERRVDAFEILFEAEMTIGHSAEVLPELEAFVDEHPMRERPRRLLMQALSAMGRSAESLAVFEDFRHVLDSELGLAPSDELGELEHAIRRPGSSILHRQNGEGHVLVERPPTRDTMPDSRLMEELLVSLQRDAAWRTRRRRGRTLLVLALLGVLVLAVIVTTTKTTTVGLLFSGRGDSGWGDLLASGLEQSQRKHEFEIDQRLVSLADSRVDFETKIRELAARSELVVVGWSFAASALAQVAGEYPDTMFVMLDGAVDLPNVTSYVFADEQGAFLVGAAAALTSESGQVGFVGGADLPVVNRYLAGFQAGVREIDPKIVVEVAYVAQQADPIRGFFDVIAAAELAQLMYQEGVDVVFHAAGHSGAGILSAARFESEAQGRHLWMVGVDIDEHEAAHPDLRPHVLTSLLERGDLVVDDAIDAFFAGELRPGVSELGVADGAVDYATTGGHLDAHRAILDRLSAQLVAGEDS